jgi:branched-chain amino acid transport system permease protein
MDMKSVNWKSVLQLGILSGIIVAYCGIVGMVEAFHEREIIDDFVTLGQFILIITPFLMAFYVAKKLKDEGENIAFVVSSGLVVGILTAIPTIALLLFNDVNEMRNIFVNINRDWIDVVTFDNRDQLMTGILTLSLVTSISGLVGSIFYVMPNVPRKALIYGLSITLGVGIFGETVRLVLQENLSRDALGEIFRRDTLKQNPAIVLFILSTGFGFVWALMGTRVREGFKSMEGGQRRTVNSIGMLIFFAVLLILPWVIGRTLSDVAVTIGLFVLMGLGLNIAIGLAGLLDLGYVTNYAVGAYILAVLTSIGPLGIGDGVFTFWMVIPIALVSAMFAGFIFAVPVLRMRGDYLAIATLGFGEIIGKLAISDWLKDIIGGAQGVQAIPKPVFFGTVMTNPEQLYYIVLGACLVTLFVSIRLNNSRTGRQWMAIREDEDVATAMGIDTARAKLLAFTLSAATGGVAGAIFAAKVGTVFPNSFTVFISINVLSLIIVGGIASNPGIVVGAIVLIGMPELLREFSDFRFLLYGVLLIAMMINRPEGLIPSQVRSREIRGSTKPKVAAGD